FHQRVDLVAEGRIGGVHALDLFHRLFGLGVFFDFVIDDGIAVGEMFAHRGVQILFLSDRVPHQFGDHGVGELAQVLGVLGGLDLPEQVFELAVVLDDDVDDGATVIRHAHSSVTRSRPGDGHGDAYPTAVTENLRWFGG